MRINLFILLATIVIGLVIFFQFLKLSQNPQALSWDELAIGIDSYALSQTGKDLHGNLPWQAIFPSYGDYKAPVAIWLTTISVKFLDLNEIAVRLPFALTSLIGVIGIGFLISEILFIAKIKNKNYILISLGLIFLLTSPWHWHFSRIAFESGLSLIFLIWAIVLAFWGLRKNSLLLPLASLLGVVSIYTYFSCRYITPLFLLPIIFIFYKKAWAKKWLILLSLILFITLQIPLYKSDLYPASQQYRLSTPNVLTNDDLIKESAELIQASNNSILARVIYHRYFFQARDLVKNFVSFYDPDFWFLNGDTNLRHHSGFGGQLLLITWPLILLGFYWLVKNWSQKINWLILIWLIAAPLTAAIPYETAHGSRSVYLLIPLALIFVLGVYQLIQSVKKFKWAKLMPFVLILGLVINFSLYLEDYFRHYSQRSSQAWQMGNKYIGQVVKNQKGNYQKIIITEAYYKPVLSVLFYNPELILQVQDQSKSQDGKYNYDWVRGFGHISFIDPKQELEKDSLYLVVPNSKYENMLLESYLFTDGQEALYVVADNHEK